MPHSRKFRINTPQSGLLEAAYNWGWVTALIVLAYLVITGGK